jgi:hypothetical protein
MKPTVPIVAAELASRFRNDILPELTGFRANIAGMAAAMLDMIGEEWDRAAARLVEENRAVQTLLRQGAEVLGEPAFAKAADGAEEDLRISALEATNAQLRTALIDLQEKVELAAGDGARQLEKAIWKELRRSVERRRIKSANF